MSDLCWQNLSINQDLSLNHCEKALQMSQAECKYEENESKITELQQKIFVLI